MCHGRSDRVMEGEPFFCEALVDWFSNFHRPIMTLSPSPKRAGRSVLCHGRSDLCVMEEVTCVMEEVTCLSGSSPYLTVSCEIYTDILDAEHGALTMARLPWGCCQQLNKAPSSYPVVQWLPGHHPPFSTMPCPCTSAPCSATRHCTIATPWKPRFGWVSGLRCCLSSSPIVSPRSSNHTNNVLHCLQIMSLQQKHSLTEIVAAEAEAERKQTQKQKQKQEQKQKQTALQTWSYGKCKFADHCWYVHDWAKYGTAKDIYKGIKPSEIPCNKGEECWFSHGGPASKHPPPPADCQ